MFKRKKEEQKNIVSEEDVNRIIALIEKLNKSNAQETFDAIGVILAGDKLMPFGLAMWLCSLRMQYGVQTIRRLHDD